MKSRTRTLLWMLVIGIPMLTIIVLIVGLTARVQHAETAADQASAAAATNEAVARDAQVAVGQLARQVRTLGGTPVVTPSDVPTPVTVTGPAGARGPRGPAGPQGLPGARGQTGRTGQAGDTGATGATGSTGTTGTDGDQGPPGAKGDTGAPGAPGAKGDTGPAGYPEEFTFASLGGTYTCTDPDGDHHYTCDTSTGSQAQS